MATKKKAEAKEAVETESSLPILSYLAPAKGARHRRKRVGFGEGSGSGKTCGKGGKGQTARGRGKVARGFEGGQMPLHRRLPKIGFTSRHKTAGENVYQLINLGRLEAIVPADGSLTLASLAEAGLIRSKTQKVKILGGGSISKKVVVEAHACSQSAKAAIEKAGGEVRIVS